MTLPNPRLVAALETRYRIDRELGQGGMATVYLAQDQRHGRMVALKVLRPELAAVIGAERFLAEIKTTAGLQHPHILPLHDSGEADGTVFYVMPYVEGESLRDRLNHEKQLPVEAAIRITKEIASALDYAHRHGIVHRDIKPENILLHDGQALVADFGISLAVSRSEGSTRMTETGMSLGTPSYMAPEQAMGEREITQRADIYALGCVLYEMLTGEPPFTGSTAQAIVARMVTEQPRGIVIQRHTVPAHVEAAVLMALEKLPADRFATASDFAEALDNPALTRSSPSITARSHQSRTQRMRSSMPMPTAVPGTTNVSMFTFSPDGQWIAFVTAAQQLRKMAISGGAAISLADNVSPTRGIAWLDDGSIVFAQNGGVRLMRIKDVGGPQTIVWQSDSVSSLVSAWFPTALPGSRGVTFLMCRGGTGCTNGTELVATDFSSGKVHSIAKGALRGEYASTGHFVYARVDGALMAVPFSTRSLDIGGAPVPVVDSITLGTNGYPAFSISRDGTLFTRTGGVLSSTTLYELAWIDRLGHETTVDSTFTFHITAFGANAGWALSPNGDRLAIGLNTDAGDNVWVKQLPRGPLSRITFDSNPSYRPRWRRDGKSVVYTSRRDGNSMLFQRPGDGTGAEQLLFKLTKLPGIFEAAWAPDEKTMALRGGGTIGVVGGRDIMIVRPGEDSTPRPLIASPQFDESGIALSPDGHWIAYESNETGRTEVYIRPFPNADGGKSQVSTDGGRAPLWNRNGRELFFVNGARELVATPVSPGVQPQLGPQKSLFKMRDDLYLANQENYTPFDVSPDGQRFIMARTVRTTAAKVAPLVVTENWFEELRQRVKKR